MVASRSDSLAPLHRSILGRVRSILLTSTLRGDHDWVLWLDSDVTEVSPRLFEELLFLGGTGAGPASAGDNAHGSSEFNDVVTPNICRRRGRDVHGYDLNKCVIRQVSPPPSHTLLTILLNSWAETPVSLKFKETLPQSELLIEGSHCERSHSTPRRYCSADLRITESASHTPHRPTRRPKRYMGQSHPARKIEPFRSSEPSVQGCSRGAGRGRRSRDARARSGPQARRSLPGLDHRPPARDGR